ncbi:tetratricopeptide repeat protein [Lacinutrix cladophorae]
MKTRLLLFSLMLIILSCSKKVTYSPEFIEETSGRYLFNQDDVIEVFYENNKLLLKWRGANKFEPLVIDENTFFITDLYKKLRFVQHPETKKRYLSVIPKGDRNQITYDYLKVSDTFKTPSMYLKSGDYQNALTGFLEIKKQDSTSSLINEREFNRLGYQFIREKKYLKAISVLKINASLHPESDNVYDSLAAAYLVNGDSLLAFNNYKKALQLNSRNRAAKKYIEAYNTKKN